MDFNYQFQAPNGTRILGGHGHGVTTFHPEKSMYWCAIHHKWFNREEVFTETSRHGVPNSRVSKKFIDGVSSHAPCRSFRAFKSHLRRHHKKLKGCKVVFCSRFVGHDIEVQL